MWQIGSLAFASPWILSGLALLPLIWWLLRITPPAPRRIFFPAIRLLFGLESSQQTPQSSPLWLILLRLAAITSLILGLAGPLINAGGTISGSGPVLFIVDDGWASAANWPRRLAAIESAIGRSERDNRSIAILTTARKHTGEYPEIAGPFSGNSARAFLAALQPKPWNVNRAKAITVLDGYAPEGSVPVIWFSNGLGENMVSEFATRLQQFGSLEVYADAPDTLPVLVFPPKTEISQLVVTAHRLDPNHSRSINLRGRAEDGRLLVEQTATFEIGELESKTSFNLPLELRNQLTRIDIEGQTSAASVALLDDRWQRRLVGLTSNRPQDKGPALLSEVFYLERALLPFSEIANEPIDKLIKSEQSVIVIPDAETTTPSERAELDRWIRRGGIVLRFAGPRLATSSNDNFTPVPIRRGGRTLGGTLHWTVPAKLAAFSEKSPFYGLTIPTDVKISRQVLAQPSLGLTQKTWASLTDGTPLVTAEQREKGWLVLIHTTAGPAWSNLSLSGLFVDMLRRIVWLSRRVETDGQKTRALAPFQTLDAFGRLSSPSGAVSAIDLTKIEEVAPGPLSPPGYYGTEEVRRALNLAPRLGMLTPLDTLPDGAVRRTYTIYPEIPIGPWLLMLALLLIVADTIATFILRGLLTKQLLRRGTTGASLLIFAGIFIPVSDVQAQSIRKAEKFALEATAKTHLAYVATGIAELDSTSRSGLSGLSDVVRRRTAAALGTPIAVNPAEDELAFFPLLYWPIDERQPEISPETARRLNRYLNNGGTIVFDTRDQQFGGRTPRITAALRRLTQKLNIPPLIPIPPEHVLTKAFYLMQDFPGRWSGGRLWVESAENRENDGVTRIIVGGHDWAGAWSIDQHGQTIFPVVPGGEKQREMAYRFGINLVMYALTGNYKADQVHVPAILERLGQ